MQVKTFLNQSNGRVFFCFLFNKCGVRLGFFLKFLECYGNSMYFRKTNDVFKHVLRQNIFDEKRTDTACTMLSRKAIWMPPSM